MYPKTMKQDILHALTRRPSRSSAAALGHKFILNGAPPRLQLLGLEALADMTCDWSVAILEEAINDRTRRRQIRERALELVVGLLRIAVERGYRRIEEREIANLAELAGIRLLERCRRRVGGEDAAVELLCSHLSEAVEEGRFGRLPDF